MAPRQPNLSNSEPLSTAELEELDRLLRLRVDHRKTIPELNGLLLRAYDCGHDTQVSLAKRGGWRHHDAVRQLLDRLRKTRGSEAAPLAEAELEQLDRLLKLRLDHWQNLTALYSLLMRAYDSGQVTQIELAERGGWRHRDSLRQILKGVREAAVTGAPITEED